MTRRVVITGMGTVNPLGNSVDEFWDGIKTGRSGIGPITLFDPAEYPARIAGEVKNLDSERFIDKKEIKKLDRFAVFAIHAAMQAAENSGLKEGVCDPERFGIVYGNGIGGIETLEESYFRLYEKGPRRIPVLTIPKLISNIAPGHVAIMLNAQGPCYSIITACAAGTDAIGNAAGWIRNGMCDMMIAGGTEAAITKLGIGGFCLIQALATKYNERPEEASRPFDRDRDGFVMAEGAGALVLEELEHAKKRGAHIYAELAGYGMSCDANHITAPHPEGRGAVLAMKTALAQAGITPEDVDYINAHGTSTQLNDPIETLAIKKTFGEHAYKLKVSSTKSMTGHLVGAAGGVEAIAGVLAIRDQFFPGTINLDEPGEGCDLNYVPGRGIPGRVRTVMSNSLGFGGHNGVIILKEYNNE